MNCILFLTLIAIADLTKVSAASKYGEACDSADECTGYGDYARCRSVKFCDKGECDCREGYVYYQAQEKCVEILRLGDTYEIPAQCQFSGRAMQPINGKCECLYGLVGSIGDERCDWGELKDLGESVTYYSECKVTKYSFEKLLAGEQPYIVSEGTEVDTNGKCACITGYKAESDGSKCVPDGKAYQETCAQQSDCDIYNYALADCVNGKCGCPSGQKMFNDVYNVYKHYDNICLDNNAKVNIEGEGECGSSVAPETFCEKGLKCGYCPGVTSKETCHQGASFASLSLVLLVACLLALATFKQN